MNMNKALQNLYHAVSGSTTTKVNISKLLVDIHYAITGVESSVKNNWSRIIDSMATNWPEGGGGSSDFSTAEVTFVNSSDEAAYLAYIPMVQDGDSSCIRTAYTSDVGSDTPCTVSIPLYKGKCSFTMGVFLWIDFDVAPVLTGAITFDAFEDAFLIEGDGTITLCGKYPDEP